MCYRSSLSSFSFWENVLVCVYDKFNGCNLKVFHCCHVNYCCPSISYISRDVCNLTVYDIYITSCHDPLIIFEVRVNKNFVQPQCFFIFHKEYLKISCFSKVFYLACAGSSIENHMQTYSKQWSYISSYNM